MPDFPIVADRNGNSDNPSVKVSHNLQTFDLNSLDFTSAEQVASVMRVLIVPNGRLDVDGIKQAWDALRRNAAPGILLKAARIANGKSEAA